MGVRKLGQQSIRTVTRNGSGSYSVTLPIDLVRQLSWQRNQRVVVEKQGNKITIVDYKGR